MTLLGLILTNLAWAQSPVVPDPAPSAQTAPARSEGALEKELYTLDELSFVLPAHYAFEEKNEPSVRLLTFRPPAGENGVMIQVLSDDARGMAEQVRTSLVRLVEEGEQKRGAEPTARTIEVAVEGSSGFEGTEILASHDGQHRRYRVLSAQVGTRTWVVMSSRTSGGDKADRIGAEMFWKTLGPRSEE